MIAINFYLYSIFKIYYLLCCNYLILSFDYSKDKLNIVSLSFNLHNINTSNSDVASTIKMSNLLITE